MNIYNRPQYIFIYSQLIFIQSSKQSNTMEVSNIEHGSFPDPHTLEIYEEIQKLNERLPNIQKWAIATQHLVDFMILYRREKAGLPIYGEDYDRAKTYTIQCSMTDLRQIGFLRDYMEFHYKPTATVERCSIRKDPTSVCPLEFRVIETYLKIERYVYNDAMRQITRNITPENVCLAMLISSKFAYQWEPESYCKRPPVLFRFLAKRLYKAELGDDALFRQLIVNRYTNMDPI